MAPHWRRQCGPRVAAHPGKSGLHPFSDARDALAARLILADAAERSLDVQYFTWNKDMVGRALLERLFRAADRGVRVRLLLDDLGTVPSDGVLLTIDSHPNIEVRMFNPVAMRSLRMLGIVADFARINRRMHNKSFLADGQVAIVGGRNIGDEYFGASAAANFADLDLAVIGPVVSEVSDAFELYWTHRTAVPISALSRQTTTPEQFAAKRAGLIVHHAAAAQSEYADTVRESEFVRQFQNGAVTYFWGQATIVSDHPDKVLTSSAKTETHLAPKLREVVDKTERELFLVSPYFVPRKNGVALLAGVRQRGARVVVLTNSLASTDACRFIRVTSVTAEHCSKQASNSTKSSRPRAASAGGRAAAGSGRRAPADRAGRACMPRRSPSTAGSVSWAPTISIPARAG